MCIHALLLCHAVSNRTFYFCRHHEHGAVSIYESEQITIKYCTFYNNTSGGYFTNYDRYLGSSGGLSIGYNSQSHDVLLSLDIVQIFIFSCTFIDNSAFLYDSLRWDNFGYGGALSLFVNITSALKFVLNDSRVIDNSAAAAGGGVYCRTQGYSNQTYTFGNNVFMKNKAPIAGGLTFTYLFSSSPASTSYGLIYNCTFKHNIAISEIAGAMAVYPLAHWSYNFNIILKYCKFYNNSAVTYGGAVDIASYNFLGQCMCLYLPLSLITG